MPNKFYAGIGARKTPPNVLALMRDVADCLAIDGWTLYSGGAQGADSAFEKGAGRMKPKTIFLPWSGFENKYPSGPFPGDQSTIYGQAAEGAMEIARYFHPAWDNLSKGAKMMHARNCHQILGPQLDTPVSFVICWTKDGKRGGGIGQALRMAEYYKIPIHDLALSECYTLWEDYTIPF